MESVMKELPETLQRRLMLLVGLSKHVGFRRDRIVWQKSLPKQQAWRVVLAEVNSTNPVFFFGYLPTEPSDEQVAQWVDACLRVRIVDQVSVRPKEIVVSGKLLDAKPRLVASLASHSLRVAVGGCIQPVAANPRSRGMDCRRNAAPGSSPRNKRRSGPSLVAEFLAQASAVPRSRPGTGR
jgi:hypothetical protein